VTQIRQKPSGEIKKEVSGKSLKQDGAIIYSAALKHQGQTADELNGLSFAKNLALQATIRFLR